MWTCDNCGKDYPGVHCAVRITLTVNPLKSGRAATLFCEAWCHECATGAGLHLTEDGGQNRWASTADGKDWTVEEITRPDKSSVELVAAMPLVKALTAALVRPVDPRKLRHRSEVEAVEGDCHAAAS